MLEDIFPQIRAGELSSARRSRKPKVIELKSKLIEEKVGLLSHAHGVPNEHQGWDLNPHRTLSTELTKAHRL